MATQDGRSFVGAKFANSIILYTQNTIFRVLIDFYSMNHVVGAEGGSNIA